MKEKILGTFVCILLIATTVLPVAETINVDGTMFCYDGYNESEREWIPFIPGSEPGSPSEAKLKSIATSELMVDSDIPGMYSVDVLIDNETYQRLDIPNEGYIDEVGKPKIPIIRRYLEIPYDVELSVEIFYSDPTELDGYNVMPVQEYEYEIDIDRQKNAKSEFIIDKGIYSSDDFYPPYSATVDEPVIMRGHKIVCLTFYPIQFNPIDQVLRVNSKIEVKVKYSRPAQIEGIEERLESEAFEQLFKAFILNYKSPDEYVTRRDNPPKMSSGADYLIITDDAFETQVQPLADWKQKKGYVTKLVKKSAIPGSGSVSDITAYLQDAYDTWSPPPTYVLLVGDADDIPTHYRTTHHGQGIKTATDLYYTTLDGTDYFPDLFIGRVSVDTTTQATTIINKIIDYECNPTTTASFYTNVLVCAYFEDGNIDGYEDKRFVLTSEEIRDYLLTQGYTVERIYCTDTWVTPTHYNSGPYDAGIPLPADLLRPGFAWDGDAADITASINAGRFIVNHRDHGDSRNCQGGSIDGWSDPHYDTSDIAGLTNGDRLPVVLSINCNTGWFDGETDPYTTRNYECFCEEFLRKQNGGVVAAIGSTRLSPSGYNDDLCLGFYDAIWPNFNPTVTTGAMYKLGQVFTYGKIFMATKYAHSSIRLTAFEEFHLFGDPEMPIWTSQPQQPPTVYRPSTIGSGGSQKFVVNVTDGTNPLPHALVCLQKGTDVHTSGYTNAGGYIFFDITPSTGGNLDITVTKHNYLPYEGNIVVTSGGATITVSPSSGHAGFSFTVTGSNFDGAETVDISLGSSPVGSVTASGGSFTTTVTVPSLPSGPTNVLAVGASSGRAAVADFFVNPGQPDPYIYSQEYYWSLSPPLPVTWDNPDVVLYDTSTGFSVPSNDLRIGTTYEIKATIHNDATVSAVDTQVTFKWAKWGTNPTWTDLDTKTITVPASGTAVTSALWTPALTGHNCLLVEIYHPYDSNTINNTGQENTDVYPISSPGEITLDVRNPTNSTALVCLEVIQNGGERQELWGTQIVRSYPQVLDPGENQTATFIINAPDDTEVGETRTFTIVATIDGETIGGVECKAVKLMELIKPKASHLYLFGIPIPFPWTVIIGPITIEADAKDFECGIDGVEFYIDDKLQSNDTEPPYEWTWKRAFFKHTLKVIAYNKCGISDSREMQVWKFF